MGHCLKVNFFLKYFTKVNERSLKFIGFQFILQVPIQVLRASKVALEVKNLPADAGAVRDVGSILGPGRFPGGGHDNPLQYSCLENAMDRGAWQATVYKAAKS